MLNLTKFVTIIFLLIKVPPIAYAQNTLSGKVIDALTLEPLAGVNIITSNKEKGIITDSQGNFIFSLSEDSLLTFSFTGYQPQRLIPASAQLEVKLQPTLTELNPVIVSASRESQSRSEAPLAIAKLPARLLEDTKPASLEQVINKVSGVFMVNLGNEQHSMSIRQPLSYNSLFLYLEDGIPIRPTGVFNHNALIEINMTAVNNIEVIKGPASSIYGSEAIGGSINFITQRASTIPAAKLSLQADNLGYKRIDVNASKTFKKVELSAAGYYANRRNGYREHNNFDKLAFTLRGDHQMGERDKLAITATLIDYKADMTGSIDSADFYSKTYPSLQTFTNRTVKAFRVRSTWDHYWSDQSKTAFTLLFRDNNIGQVPAYRIRNNPNHPLQASGEINGNSYQSFGSVVQHMQELSFMDARIIAGVSLDYSPNTYYAEYVAVDRNEEGLYTGFTRLDSVLTDYHIGLRNIATYAQLEISPLKRLRLVMAARYDHFDYHYDNYLTPNAFSGAPDSKDKFDNLSPKVGLTYDFGKEKGIYGNYSIGFVPPQVSELYRGVKVPVLEPSVYHNYEAGGWFTFANKGYLDVSLYQLEGNNEIISVYLDDGTTENRNAGKTAHRGVEYTVKYTPFYNLALRLSSSHAQHKYVEYVEQGNQYDGKQMAAAPSWLANAEVMYYPAFLKGARMSVEWQHVGSYFMDVANTEQYKGFDVFNLRLGYHIKSFEAWCHVLNLTNSLYATQVSKSRFGESYAPGDPTAFTLGIGYNFSVKPSN